MRDSLWPGGGGGDYSRGIEGEGLTESVEELHADSPGTKRFHAWSSPKKEGSFVGDLTQADSGTRVKRKVTST